ncbi:prepilin peptidase [Microbacterium sp. CFBP 13617]|uniref:prepilin peptidase n=1 Tax=Microbacterium sp. CFBP 13617 TaxID=2774035 RepID=UPI001783BB1E|nr:A24 family peptidase [Microbacterium sp. CFBP 13617]MBD8218774.1 prepilin peptidase [Microbacterium sp. CFBP 13617]
MPWALAPALAVFAVLGLALAVIDVRTHRLPDALVLPGGATILVLLVGSALNIGEPERVGGVVGGAALAFVGCLAVHLARPAAFGGGDVKLAAVCGAVLGWCGVEAAVSGLAAGFVAGGVAAAGTIAAGERGAALAFGPFLLAGTWWRVLSGPW